MISLLKRLLGPREPKRDPVREIADLMRGYLFYMDPEQWLHRIPLGDEGHRYDLSCWCRPTVNEHDRIIWHHKDRRNALDEAIKREEQEEAAQGIA